MQDSSEHCQPPRMQFLLAERSGNWKNEIWSEAGPEKWIDSQDCHSLLRTGLNNQSQKSPYRHTSCFKTEPFHQGYATIQYTVLVYCSRSQKNRMQSFPHHDHLACELIKISFFQIWKGLLLQLTVFCTQECYWCVFGLSSKRCCIICQVSSASPKYSE